MVRNTKQKATILACLQENSAEHFTADELVDALKQRGTPVARATVYRFLATLEKNGQVRKYLLNEGAPACYQYIEPGDACHQHYHLMCTQCGEIVHFDDQKLRPLLQDISRTDGFLIDESKTVFYGKCKPCTQGTQMEER